MHLDRITAVLEIIAQAGQPLCVAEIHHASKLPKPTCYRLIRTLHAQGLLDEPTENGRFVIGDRLRQIALRGMPDTDVQQRCAPWLAQAATTLDETVCLSRLRDNTVEIIHIETPSDPSRAHVHPGLGARPLHACSCAKAIAAFSSVEFQDRVLGGHMAVFTEHTMDADTLRREFELIRKRGYAECNQEIDVGIASVAAPITVDAHEVQFSVAAVGPIRRLTDAKRHAIGLDLIALASRLQNAIQQSNTIEAPQEPRTQHVPKDEERAR